MILIYAETELYKIIGDNIKFYRQLYNIGKDKKNRITQEKLAELANISTSLVGNMESEKIDQGISLFTLYKISSILSIPINHFFIPVESKRIEEEIGLFSIKN